MNKKGFATAGILYTLLIISLIIMITFLNDLQGKKSVLDSIKNETVNAIDKKVECSYLGDELDKCQSFVRDLVATDADRGDVLSGKSFLKFNYPIPDKVDINWLLENGKVTAGTIPKITNPETSAITTSDRTYEAGYYPNSWTISKPTQRSASSTTLSSGGSTSYSSGYYSSGWTVSARSCTSQGYYYSCSSCCPTVSLAKLGSYSGNQTIDISGISGYASKTFLLVTTSINLSTGANDQDNCSGGTVNIPTIASNSNGQLKITGAATKWGSNANSVTAKATYDVYYY